jgi:hypothetical protein
MMMAETFSFELEQGGITVASGNADSFEDIVREGRHYAMMYAQDGPVVLSFRDGDGKLIRAALAPTLQDEER